MKYRKAKKVHKQQKLLSCNIRFEELFTMKRSFGCVFYLKKTTPFGAVNTHCNSGENSLDTPTMTTEFY